MHGIFGFAVRKKLSSIVSGIALALETLSRHRGCDVVDLDEAPHWLHRDIGTMDGRVTRQRLRDGKEK